MPWPLVHIYINFSSEQASGGWAKPAQELGGGIPIVGVG